MKQVSFGSFLFFAFIGLIVVSAQDNNKFPAEKNFDESSQATIVDDDKDLVVSPDKQNNTKLKAIKDGLANTSSELVKRLERKEAEIKKLKSENDLLKEQLKKQDEAIRTIAEAFRIPNNKVDSMGLLGITTEIKMRIEDTKYFGTSFLSETDLRFIEDVCVDDPRVIKIIKSYDSFIKQVKANP